ncbi:hypothetical protein HDN1F_03310 [gamma proteobacterium HdN1]|nr:hypothetical protein HDN1F_03310 [gamma proteobacterium HdN1]
MTKVPQSGSTLVITLIALLILSLACLSMLQSGIFSQRIVAGGYYGLSTFNAAESALRASVASLSVNAELRARLESGEIVQTCLSRSGLHVGGCGVDGFPAISATTGRATSQQHQGEFFANVETRYLGSKPADGFSQDLVLQKQYQSVVSVASKQAQSSFNANLQHEQIWQLLVLGDGSVPE